MSDFKEFQGKGLDEAIESACNYFNLKRDRLEIEILAGGSSGIFGIMGVKKARVKARPRVQVNATDMLGDKEAKDKAPKKSSKTKEAKKSRPAKSKSQPKVAPESGNVMEPEIDYDILDAQINGNVVEPEIDLDTIDEEVNGNIDPELLEQKKGKNRRDRKPREKKGRPTRSHKDSRHTPKARDRKPREHRPREERPQREERPRPNMDDFDPEVLTGATMEVMTELLKPIVGETSIEVSIETDRVKVFIDDEENSGLIIGREGQTLSSLQYLVNRLVSRKMEASVRIQVDTGDYRKRQDEKLSQLAEYLAEKAVDVGRTQSTKPLSSYHRRVVHLALQDNEDVFTRSKGEGPLKRVLIVPQNRRNDRRS